MTGILFSLLVLLAAAPVFAEAGWSRLPSLPDREGFAGPFAGVSDGALLVAGGANFPEKKPWEGGTKIWYDTIFVLDRPDGQWKTAGRLPRALGYGISVTHRNSVICVGGSDPTRHYADAFRLEWKVGKIVTTALPPLPKPLANASGALVGDMLYIAAGQEKPDATEASRSAYAMDLAAPEPRWRELDPCPGAARILPVAAAFDGAFYLAGGAELLAGKDGKAERRYLKDAWKYDVRTGWKRIADLRHVVVAALSPAPTDTNGFYVLGGDDGSQVGSPPDKHRGFLRKALRYDAKADKWLNAGELPAGPVTTTTVRWKDSWVIPSGEVRPGVRSPDVWRWTPQE